MTKKKKNNALIITIVLIAIAILIYSFNQEEPRTQTISESCTNDLDCIRGTFCNDNLVCESNAVSRFSPTATSERGNSP